MKNKSCALLLRQINCFSSIGISFTHHQSLILTLRRTFSQWHIVGAVCLERKPVISQPLNPLEERYLNYLQKLEFEKSYLSDHEKRHLKDQQINEKLQMGQIDEADAISQQTAQDFEDASIEEFNKYKPASRTTEADVKNDRRSIQRKLDQSLLLVIKEKLGNDFKWILPQAVHQNGETLRQTAERALNEVCLNEGNVKFIGNAPVGHYKYKYPKAARGNGVCGAKVFFFKAQLLNAKQEVQMKQTEIISDHLWLTHSELGDVLQSMYCKAVQSFLFPDTFIIDSNENVQAQASSSDEDEHLASSTGW
ncbi:LOW QUALITY PROTEIN: 39S ribosomal protein L46, mitochondrial-like [Uloborus diversus]|uniref:LOW QUALITY PROTEIN: 39S ribosomal protein L46, mitochondrial-like n=1 Tax=Uloborus diversus TaxID=327109 RepID=UPI00240953E6|nr:LOW QUALITY PROTEIN: 39S ribosomal protein L46, mitochondrial-like [Uloborus diversus]